MNAGDQFGRYRLIERVGRGGMGVLYRAEDPVLGREVAIKMMAGDLAGDDEHSRERFFREARAAARLQHRNIVTVFEFAEEEGVPFIVMEYLQGRPLSQRMQEEPRLTLEESLDIVAQLCAGLHFAHDHGVVHRDVKPANVWLMADGTVKLLDFGIARMTAMASGLTQHGAVLGSAEYMAPEQIAGTPVDGRADVFSAAVVLYELVSGRKPFVSESPTSTMLQVLHEEPPALEVVAAHVPPAVADAIIRGLQKDPADRFPDADLFSAELQLLRLSMQGTGDTVFGDFATTQVSRAAVAPPPAAAAKVAPRRPAAAPRWRIPPMPAFNGIGRGAVPAAATLLIIATAGVATRWMRSAPAPAPAAVAAPPVAATPVTSSPVPAVTAPPPRPALSVRRGQYFQYALPVGWGASETANGVDLTDPAGATLVSFALLMNTPGQTSPSAFLTRILAAIGATGIAIDALQPQEPIAGAGGLSWQRVNADLRYHRGTCDCQARSAVALMQVGGSYNALITLYQAPQPAWAGDRLWLSQVADSIAIIATKGIALLDQLELPRSTPLDEVFGQYQQSWAARGVSPDRISQVRRESTMGYEEMQSPTTGEHFRMPLETYDGTIGGYRSPDPLKSGEILVRPR